MLQRSSGFVPPVPTTCRVGFGVFSVNPGCHSSGSIRNYLVYLPPAHRVKKTQEELVGGSETPGTPLHDRRHMLREKGECSSGGSSIVALHPAIAVNRATGNLSSNLVTSFRSRLKQDL